jgi:hypothetical protein
MSSSFGFVEPLSSRIIWLIAVGFALILGKSISFMKLSSESLEKRYRLLRFLILQNPSWTMAL